MLFLKFKLRKYNGGENDERADDFSWSHNLSKDQRAAYRSKYRLKREENRRNTGIEIFLSDDLKGVGNTAGENSKVKQGENVISHGRHIDWRFKYQRANQVNNKSRYELYKREMKTIAFVCEKVDRHNLSAEDEGA